LLLFRVINSMRGPLDSGLAAVSQLSGAGP
jgi:hypothetical protein